VIFERDSGPHWSLAFSFTLRLPVRRLRLISSKARWRAVVLRLSIETQAPCSPGRGQERFQ
jgi:hypothetical protein